MTTMEARWTSRRDEDRRRFAEVRGPQFFLASVEDSFAHAGVYLIRTPAGPIVPASALQHSLSGLPLGARPMGGYPPKTRVLVFYDTSMEPPAVILGQVGRGASDARLVLPDSLVMRSRVGLFDSAMHGSAFDVPERMMGNFSAGRAADTLPGDWGAITDNGMAVLLGRLLAMLRASDGAKLEMFAGDDLVRLTAGNFELNTLGSREQRFCDFDGLTRMTRSTPWLWEGLGVAKKGSPAATNKPKGRLGGNTEDCSWEPVKPDQLIVQRILTLEGELADLRREMVALPPEGLEYETLAGKTNYRGVYDARLGPDGGLDIRSAKGGSFFKSFLLPVPKQLKEPNDPTGDIDPPEESEEDSDFTYAEPGARPLQERDARTWRLNGVGLEGISGRTKDWHLPEEADIAQGDAEPSSATTVGHAFSANMPEVVEIQVDHRTGRKVRYYRSQGGWMVGEDGSFLIEDAWGSRILMRDGRIHLQPALDVWVQPGRNFVVWAPHDIILRAGNSWDLSGSKGDGRLLAGRNVHMLSGNSGTGGMLLECRAEGPPDAKDFDELGQGVNGHGIILAARESAIQAYGKDIYLGAEGGEAVLDAGEEGTAVVRGGSLAMRALSRVDLLVKSSEGSEIFQTLSLNGSDAALSTGLRVGGRLVLAPAQGPADLVVGGSIIVHGQVVAGGAVVTNSSFAALAGSPYVGELEAPLDLGETPETLSDDLERGSQEVSDLVEAAERPVDGQSDEEPGPGREAYRDRIGFSCRRTQEDLMLDPGTFVLYESLWQRRARAGGGAAVWDEPVVMGPGDRPTLPHPGREAWQEWASFATVDEKNVVRGVSKSREDLTSEGADAVRGMLSSKYLIAIQG